MFQDFVIGRISVYKEKLQSPSSYAPKDSDSYKLKEAYKKSNKEVCYRAHLSFYQEDFNFPAFPFEMGCYITYSQLKEKIVLLKSKEISLREKGCISLALMILAIAVHYLALAITSQATFLVVSKSILSVAKIAFGFFSFCVLVSLKAKNKADKALSELIKIEKNPSENKGLVFESVRQIFRGEEHLLFGDVVTSFLKKAEHLKVKFPTLIFFNFKSILHQEDWLLIN